MGSKRPVRALLATTSRKSPADSRPAPSTLSSNTARPSICHSGSVRLGNVKNARPKTPRATCAQLRADSRSATCVYSCRKTVRSQSSVFPMNDSPSGWARRDSSQLGTRRSRASSAARSSRFPNLTLPEWQIEGLAVFEESADGQGRLSAGDFREVVASSARDRPFGTDESRQWRTRGVAVGNGMVRVRRLLPRVPGTPVWRRQIRTPVGSHRGAPAVFVRTCVSCGIRSVARPVVARLRGRRAVAKRDGVVLLPPAS